MSEPLLPLRQEPLLIAPVSVVIPCFRCSKTIARAIQSIECQTLKPAEVILVEDASGDDTLDILRKIESAHFGWIKIIALQENQGAASARNFGWSVATQPYIAFLDADDAWHPQKIEIQYAYMKDYPEIVLCGHGHKVISQENMALGWNVGEKKAQRIGKWALLLSNKFITPSVMVRRNVEQRFMLGRRHMEDHLLWLEIVCAGGAVAKLWPELAAIYKSPFGISGLSAQIWLMEKGDLNNYKHLYQRKLITFGQWLSLSIYSWIKFARRLVMYWGNLHWKRGQ